MSAVTVTATGPVSGLSPGTGAPGYASVTVLSCGAALRIGIEDSADGTAWAPVAVFDFLGPVGEAPPESVTITRSVTPAMCPNMRSQLRVNVYLITGSAVIQAN